MKELSKASRKNGFEIPFFPFQMKGRNLAGLILGILLALAGGTFALQGSGMLGKGSPMDNTSTWIYIGSAVFVVGLILIFLSVAFSRQKKQMAAQN